MWAREVRHVGIMKSTPGVFLISLLLWKCRWLLVLNTTLQPSAPLPQLTMSSSCPPNDRLPSLFHVLVIGLSASSLNCAATMMQSQIPPSPITRVRHRLRAVPKQSILRTGAAASPPLAASACVWPTKRAFPATCLWSRARAHTHSWVTTLFLQGEWVAVYPSGAVLNALWRVIWVLSLLCVCIVPNTHSVLIQLLWGVLHCCLMWFTLTGGDLENWDKQRDPHTETKLSQH